MGNYFIDITDQAREDIMPWNKVGDEVILKKIKRIIFELSACQPPLKRGY